MGYGGVEQVVCGWYQLIGLYVLIQNQQQFGLFGLVVGLEVLWVEQVFGIVLVVVLVDLLLLVVVFLDQVVGLCGLVVCYVVGQQQCVVEIVLFVVCFECGQYCFVYVYVGVLVMVVGEGLVCIGFVFVQIEFRFLEVVFEQCLGFVYLGVCFVDVCFQCVVVGQQYEGYVVVVVGGIFDNIIVQGLGIVVCDGVVMYFVQEVDVMFDCFEVVGVVEFVVCYCMVEYEVCVVDQVMVVGVVYVVVVMEVVEEFVCWVDFVGLVECYVLCDVGMQEVR